MRRASGVVVTCGTHLLLAGLPLVVSTAARLAAGLRGGGMFSPIASASATVPGPPFSSRWRLSFAYIYAGKGTELEQNVKITESPAMHQSWSFESIPCDIPPAFHRVNETRLKARHTFASAWADGGASPAGGAGESAFLFVDRLAGLPIEDLLGEPWSPARLTFATRTTSISMLPSRRRLLPYSCR